MEVPVWVIWTMIASPFVGGFGVAIFFKSFMTKEECKSVHGTFTKNHSGKLEELQENRREVWEKIDEIHDDTTKIKINLATTDTKVAEILNRINIIGGSQ